MTAPKDELKQLMQRNYLTYASYVILDRAIPNAVDGLKPVQRRILYTLLTQMAPDRLHKVANIVGQTMALHPHGDAPIYEALVYLANKGYLIERQGNFGNPCTGDPPAAARYIEAKLSAMAQETLYNPDLTETLPSYDGRHQEPVALPAKIPLVLMQGVDGIAVGMATHILPHNFVELIEAEIALLEGRSFELLPDFPSGGLMDASEYAQGKGKVKLRAKIEIRDPKTLVIEEVCYGTTTESLIRSIDEAAKRGKIKIEAIHDYTAEKVEIEIKLPRGQYAQELIDALFAYTECEVSLNSHILVIKDNLPWQTDVPSLLAFHVEKLQGYFKRELELEQERIKEKIFARTLERIFIEERLYKRIETMRSYEAVHDAIEKGLEPFHEKLSRLPTKEDRERLLAIPIRRISLFDMEKNRQEIELLEQGLLQAEKNLKHLKKYTINYLTQLLKKYGDLFPRKTQIQKIEALDLRAIATKNMKIGVDAVSGFVGTKVLGDTQLECTNFDKLLVLLDDGSYSVFSVPEKQYVLREGAKIAWIGVADRVTVITAIYRDPKTLHAFVKRFVVDKFIMDKVYRFIDEGMQLLLLTTELKGKLSVQLVPKVKQKISQMELLLETVLIKGVSAKGVRISPRAVKKVTFGGV